MDFSRRQFSIITLSAVASAALSSTSLAASREKEILTLKRRNVLAGLRRGLNFPLAVEEVLTELQEYSTEQTLVGGCVLNLASGQAPETVHILVMADPLETAKAFEKNTFDTQYCSQGNSSSFVHQEQQFLIEYLSEELYEERLKELIPGSTINDLYVEFAHQLITYNVQTRRYSDPKQAIGRNYKIKLKRVSPAQNSSSVIKTIVESKKHGLELTNIEQASIDKTLARGLRRHEYRTEETEVFLSQLCGFIQYHDTDEIKQLLYSNLAKDTLGKTLGYDIKNLVRTYYKVKRNSSRNTPEGQLWLATIQCVEDTLTVNTNETITYLHPNQSGRPQLLRAAQERSNSVQIANSDNIENLHLKKKKRKRRS